MKLTSANIESTINDKKLETENVDRVKETLQKETAEYISSLDGMKNIGEFQETISTLRTEISAEVEMKRNTEIKDKLAAIHKVLEETKKDNTEMLDRINGNIDKAKGIKGELTSGSVESSAKAVEKLNEASSERKELEKKLDEQVDKEREIDKESNNIKV